MLLAQPPLLLVRRPARLRGRRSAVPAALAASPPPEPQPQPPPQQPLSSSPQGQQQQRQRELPWALGAYYTKKLRREADALGNLLQAPDAIAQPPGWDSAAQLRLAVASVAAEAGLPQAELRARVERLLRVLPDLQLAFVKPGDLARLASRVDDVAAKLLALKHAFPAADVSALGAANARLLLLQLPDFRASLAETQALLAGLADASPLLAAAPSLLDPAQLAAVLGEVQRLFGARVEPLQLLAANPGLALSCESLQSQERGGRDAAYVADLFAAVPASSQEQPPPQQQQQQQQQQQPQQQQQQPQAAS